MFATTNGILSIVSLVAGAITAVAGVISLANGSWDQFLFVAGLCLLAFLGLGVMILISDHQKPAPPPGSLAAKRSEASSGAEAWFVVTFAMAGSYALLVTVIWPIGAIHGPHEWVQAIGAAAVFVFPITIIEGGPELLAAIRESKEPARPWPRCGHPVPAGVMQCGVCEYDFWTIGGEQPHT